MFLFSNLKQMWVYLFNKYLIMIHMHHDWYIVMHIIYGKVYSLLKLTSKRVVVLNDQEWRTSNPIVTVEGSVGVYCPILRGSLTWPRCTCASETDNMGKWWGERSRKSSLRGREKSRLLSSRFCEKWRLNIFSDLFQ